MYICWQKSKQKQSRQREQKTSKGHQQRIIRATPPSRDTHVYHTGSLHGFLIKPSIQALSRSSFIHFKLPSQLMMAATPSKINNHCWMGILGFYERRSMFLKKREGCKFSTFRYSTFTFYLSIIPCYSLFYSIFTVAILFMLNPSSP